MRPLLLLLAALLCAAAQAHARAAHGAAHAQRPNHPHHPSHQAHRLLRDGAAAAAIGAPAPATAVAPASAAVAGASTAGGARIDACRQRCPSAYQPVCSGGTYLNACWAACMGAEPFAVGDCDAAADRFQRAMGSGCEARCTAVPGAASQPVCAENGFTFTSACVAKCSSLSVAPGTCWLRTVSGALAPPPSKSG